jgi:hypothetical protein
MRLSKSLLFAGGAIAAVFLATGICVFKKPRATSQANVCINNLRPTFFPPGYLHPEQVLALTPLGMTFSNVVAIFGTNYWTSETNAHDSFYVGYHGKATIQIQSNVVVGVCDIKLGYATNSNRFVAPPD